MVVFPVPALPATRLMDPFLNPPPINLSRLGIPVLTLSTLTILIKVYLDYKKLSVF
jgi:hypothetical protein